MNSSGPDDEVSLSVELTETGVSGKAKARALSTFQRWLGSAFATAIARNNRAAARERVLGSLEQKALHQLGSEALERLRSNVDAVDGVIDALGLPGTDRKHQNTGAVFEKAVEDLRLNPPSDHQANSGDSEITPEISDRLEHYASGATTEEVRERWGRVLAAEIRQPGTFSLKVLRIIDELDGLLPALFEHVASSRYDGDCIPRCMSGRVGYTEAINLEDAGLMHDAGSSETFQLRYFAEAQFMGEKVWMHRAQDSFVTIPRSGPFDVPSHKSEDSIISHDGKPAIPAYILTSAGRAITTILPPVDNSGRYLQLVRTKVPDARLWTRKTKGGPWIEREVPPTKPEILENPAH